MVKTVRGEKAPAFSRKQEIEWPDPLIDRPKGIICILIDDVTERRREWVPLIL
ncbi:hypothetical protein [Hoeflea sp. IMCC20628]|uniref:hypothetical protein n=1 Tax=Hoeflea sp. IMCC20628 TaxID=1620421 RepID=UPI0018CD64FA|nr:hypothetical protein [Hoeflea sp. IMCC20628]